MFSGLPLAFASPWVLSGLLLLPVIWWLLRLTPPRPREVSFPPTRLLLDIEQHEETPQKSPWWLTLLRLLLAAFLILAVSGPIWRPLESVETGDGVLWLLMDNGWQSTKHWEDQVRTAEQMLEVAQSEGRPVLFATTADGPSQDLAPGSADAALERLRAIAPRPYSPSRSELVLGLRKAANEAAPGAVIWLSDGSQDKQNAPFAADLASIADPAPITVYSGLTPYKALKSPENTADALSIKVVRHPNDTVTTATINALDLKGLALGEASVTFGEGETEAIAEFALPSELRNDIARLEVAGTSSAASVQLIDDSWRRRVVGIISGQSGDLAQPLLSPLYYLERALTPFSDLRKPKSADLAESVPELLETGISVLVLADIGRLPDISVETIEEWVRDGGTLVRFAGPRTAGGTDRLIPVTLRQGDRSLGGSLSWKQPQRLTEFSDTSPFAGIPMPKDVTVTRQVLAEPTSELPDKTWAMLEDGTPLVTAASFGRGTIVLFHVTADTAWSNLPLSGTFLDMLRRMLSISNAVVVSKTQDATAQGTLPPHRLLDGFGDFTSPPADVAPIATRDFQDVTAGRKTPPGLYGTEDGFRALNLMRPDDTVDALDTEALGDTASVLNYATANPVDLRAVLFSLAFLFLMLDVIAVMAMGGAASRLKMRRAGLAGSLLLAGLLLADPNSASAQQTLQDDYRALQSTLETRLAYVQTGIADIDRTSMAGLTGLTQFLMERTALEPGEPVGVDISKDELAFYSLLYWPIDPSLEKPDSRTMARIDTFVRNGGSILFDTRDHITAGTRGFATTPATQKLREILEDLDIPPLEPVPPDHVLTKAFFLLDSFPGRYATSPLWVEVTEGSSDTSSRPVRAGDGVSPVLITGNDLAAAWAIEPSGTFMFPVVPNDPVQRDYAFRAGVNIVMYSFTGNYKADQVHVPALLERLGQ